MLVFIHCSAKKIRQYWILNYGLLPAKVLTSGLLYWMLNANWKYCCCFLPPPRKYCFINGNISGPLWKPRYTYLFQHSCEVIIIIIKPHCLVREISFLHEIILLKQGQTIERGTSQQAEIGVVHLRAVGFQRRNRFMWLEVFKDNHIRDVSCTLYQKKWRKVDGIWMCGWKGLREQSQRIADRDLDIGMNAIHFVVTKGLVLTYIYGMDSIY